MKKSAKVLIADDVEEVRITLRAILSIVDFEIKEVETAGEAFRQITQDYFDLVILDNKLPDYDGIEVIRKLRELQIEIGSIILLTGYPEQNTKVEAQNLDVFFLNKKDLSLNHLLETIKQILKDITN